MSFLRGQTSAISVVELWLSLTSEEICARSSRRGERGLDGAKPTCHTGPRATHVVVTPNYNGGEDRLVLATPKR